MAESPRNATLDLYAPASGSTTSMDFNSLKRLLQETSLACQKCLVAVDTTAHVPLSPRVISGMETQSELVERLQRRCSELEEQLNHERQRKDGQLSDTQQQQIDGIILQYKQKLAAVEEDKLAIEDENRRLRVELAKSEQQKTTLLAQVEAQSVELAQSQAGNDHIHHLEEQLKQYQIDFKSERQDRSAAEARVSELEYRLSRQLQQQDRQTMQSISQRREAALQFYRDEYDSQHHADGAMQTDSHEELPDGEAYDEIDSQPPQPSPVAKLSKKLADAVVLDSVKQ